MSQTTQKNSAAETTTERKPRVAPAEKGEKKQRRSIKTDRDFLTALLKQGEATVVDAKLLKKNTKSSVWAHFGAIKLSGDFTHESIDLESIVDLGKIMQICKNFVACYNCFAVFKYDGHAYGTTGLIKHIKLCATNKADTNSSNCHTNSTATTKARTNATLDIKPSTNTIITPTIIHSKNRPSPAILNNANNSTAQTTTATVAKKKRATKGSGAASKKTAPAAVVNPTPIRPHASVFANKPKRPRRSIRTDRDYLTSLLQNGTAKVVDAKYLKKNIKSTVWSHYGAILLANENAARQQPHVDSGPIDIESNVENGKIMHICKSFVACNECFTVFKYDGHAYGTTGLVKHIKLCPKTPIVMGESIVSASAQPVVKQEPQKAPVKAAPRKRAPAKPKAPANAPAQNQAGEQQNNGTTNNGQVATVAGSQHSDGIGTAILQTPDGTTTTTISEEQISNDNGDGTIMVLVYEDANEGVVMAGHV